MNIKVDKKKPACVTGANGFIASWLVKKLVEEGVTVHATVRDIKDVTKTDHLKKISKKGPGKVVLFESNLLIENSFSKAMTNCSIVFHTASPFIVDVKKLKNAKKDLFDPAVEGTKNVVNSVNKTKSIKRLVLTSSCAAIYGDAADLQNIESGTLTEENWNVTSSMEHQPYSYSKVMAERLCWEELKKQNQWDLVVINPPVVLGPSLSETNTSGSLDLMKAFGDGSLKSGAPPIQVGMVNVIDVAEAHFKGGYLKNASGRYIVCEKSLSFLDLARIFEKEFNNFVFPKKELPKWLVWLVGPIMDKSITRKMISRNMGHSWKADNSKGIKELGLKYNSVEKAAVKMFQQMIDLDVFRK
jgi:nucleoside-diphosphate-sugar epimerase